MEVIIVVQRHCDVDLAGHIGGNRRGRGNRGGDHRIGAVLANQGRAGIGGRPVEVASKAAEVGRERKPGQVIRTRIKSDRIGVHRARFGRIGIAVAQRFIINQQDHGIAATWRRAILDLDRMSIGVHVAVAVGGLHRERHRRVRAVGTISIGLVVVGIKRPGLVAAGVNRFDHYIREGTVVSELSFPHILGSDAAGEVAELGEGVTGFKIGERILVAPGYPQKEDEINVRPTISAPSFALPGLHVSGTYAQYMEVPAYAVIKDNTGLQPEEVATFPVVLATAVHALKQIGEVKAGDKVLIHSGASGSGSMQIQVAKAIGADVATTVRSDAKSEVARKAGADLVINTSNEDLVERVKQWSGGQGVDVIIDNLAGDVLAKSIEAARPMGIIVAFGFAAGPEVKFDIRSLFFTQKELRGSMASDTEDLEFGLELVRQGKIKAVIDCILPLSQASEAHRLIANNEVAGNIVLLPWAN